MLERIRLFMEGAARQKLLRYMAQTEGDGSSQAILAASNLHAHHALLFSSVTSKEMNPKTATAFLSSVAYVAAWYVQQDAD